MPEGTGPRMKESSRSNFFSLSCVCSVCVRTVHAKAASIAGKQRKRTNRIGGRRKSGTFVICYPPPARRSKSPLHTHVQTHKVQHCSYCNCNVIAAMSPPPPSLGQLQFISPGSSSNRGNPPSLSSPAKAGIKYAPNSVCVYLHT